MENVEDCLIPLVHCEPGMNRPGDTGEGPRDLAGRRSALPKGNENMISKQIREQAEILCAHMHQEELDFEFIEAHALHLTQLAQSILKDRVATIRPRVSARPSASRQIA